jgi:hypothetical protein
MPASTPLLAPRPAGSADSHPQPDQPKVSKSQPARHRRTRRKKHQSKDRMVYLPVSLIPPSYSLSFTVEQERSRHVKCDETHPVCKNCQKFYVSCTYPVPIEKPKHPTCTLLCQNSGWKVGTSALKISIHTCPRMLWRLSISVWKVQGWRWRGVVEAERSTACGA